MTGHNDLDISNRIKLNIEEGLIIPVTSSPLDEDHIFEILCYTQNPEMKVLLKMKKSTITKEHEDFFHLTRVEGLSVSVHGNVLNNLPEYLSVFVNDITIAPTPIPIPQSLQDELGLIEGDLVPQQQRTTEIGKNHFLKEPKMKISSICDASVELNEDIKFDAYEDDIWKNDKVTSWYDDNNDFDTWDEIEEDYRTEGLTDRLVEFSNRIYGTANVNASISTEEEEEEEEGQISASLVVEVEVNNENVRHNAITEEFTKTQDNLKSTEAKEEVVTIAENSEVEEVAAVVKSTEDINAVKPIENINAVEPTENTNVVEPTEDEKIIATEPTKVEDNEAMNAVHFEEENPIIVEIMDTTPVTPPNETSILPVRKSSRETESADHSMNFQKEQEATNQREGLMQKEDQKQVVLHEPSSIGKSSGAVRPKRKRKSKMSVDPGKLRRSPRLALKKKVQYFPPKRVRRRLLKNN